MKIMRITFAFLLLLLLGLPATALAQREKLSPQDLAIVREKWPEAVRNYSGLRSLVLSPGTGEKPRPGQLVSVLYSGRLIDGTVFDENLNRESPFVFRLGRGLVIAGWEEGLRLMQVGEKRLFIIPYELAYGTRGDPPKIPRQAALVFEVELLEIRPEPAAK